tara:strand:- start:75 stop:218 length:144 start_codon:yes stop_codon:yes gene_type:complete
MIDSKWMQQELKDSMKQLDADLGEHTCRMIEHSGVLTLRRKVHFSHM